MPVFSASFIGSGKFWPAFTEIPEGIIPANSCLWEYQTDLGEQPKPPRHQLTGSSSIADKRARRAVEKDIAKLESEAESTDSLADELNDEPDSEQTRQAVENIQQGLKADFERQKASRESQLRHDDMLNDDLVREHDEKLNNGEFDSLSPGRVVEVDDDDEPPPPKPSNNHAAKAKASKSKLFVLRGSEYLPVSSVAKLKRGESLFRFRKREFGVSAKWIKTGTVK